MMRDRNQKFEIPGMSPTHQDEIILDPHRQSNDQTSLTTSLDHNFIINFIINLFIKSININQARVVQTYFEVFRHNLAVTKRNKNKNQEVVVSS